MIEKYKLSPRDAIHAACAVVNGIHIVISDGEDFDRVKEIERMGLMEKSRRPH